MLRVRCRRSVPISVTEYDYRQDFDTYLEGVENGQISSLRDVLTPDDKYSVLQTPYGKVTDPMTLHEIRHRRLISYNTGEYGCEALENAIDSSISEETSHAAESRMRELGRAQGIDGVLKTHAVDVILGPGSGPLYSVAAAAGKTVDQFGPHS